MRSFLDIRFWQILSSLAAVLTFAAPVYSQNPNPGVIPPNAAPHGKTYGEWSAAWSKWAYEAPDGKNPVLDTTGANCAVGQSGHVWFLAGTFFVGPQTGPAVRTCTIPPGQMLFFPIGNGFCVEEGDGSFAVQR